MAGYTLSAKMLGFTQLQKALENAQPIVKQELAKALNKAANDVIQDVAQPGGAPHKTGRLWGSFHQGDPNSVTQFATQENLAAIVGTNLKYAKYQEQGTGIYGPHEQAFTIQAKNKKALYWEGASHPVKKVTIQGVRPKWFLKQALENVKPKLSEYLRIASTRIIDQIKIA